MTLEVVMMMTYDIGGDDDDFPPSTCKQLRPDSLFLSHDSFIKFNQDVKAGWMNEKTNSTNQ